MALGALSEYIQYHEDHGKLELIGEIVSRSDQFRSLGTCDGGVEILTKREISRYFNESFSTLAQTRKSVREYSSTPVPLQVIEAATKVAQLTPSVCNRQGSRVHVLAGDEIKSKALELQNGNRGFTDQIDKVLVVSVSQSIFASVTERNQAYVDGGMFAMSLLYALTERGVATCCLNWSSTLKNDVALRELGFIPDDEVVIMFIAIGNYQESFRVARSIKKLISKVLFIHN
jgi:nitroreductase